MPFLPSRHHPGTRSRARVVSATWAATLPYLLLPVMVLATISALRMMPALHYLTLITPLAMLASAVWTYLVLLRRPAGVWVSEGHVGVVSVLDVVLQIPPQMAPVVDVRRLTPFTTASVGTAVYEFHDPDWPQPELLLQSLQSARDYAWHAA